MDKIPPRAPLYRAHTIVMCKSFKDITPRDLLQSYVAIELSENHFRVVKNAMESLDDSKRPITELADFVSETYEKIKQLHYEIV